MNQNIETKKPCWLNIKRYYFINCCFQFVNLEHRLQINPTFTHGVCGVFILLPRFKALHLTSRPFRPLSAQDRVKIMKKYLLGFLSTLFISSTVGVFLFPGCWEFGGKFRFFIQSQMFANLLNIHNISAVPQSKPQTRLITGYSLRGWLYAIWHNSNVTHAKRRVAEVQ